jgi:hypothetical protein
MIIICYFFNFFDGSCLTPTQCSSGSPTTPCAPHLYPIPFSWHIFKPYALIHAITGHWVELHSGAITAAPRVQRKLHPTNNAR